MASLFSVPDWDETKNTISYDFQKKKIKSQKKKKNGATENASDEPKQSNAGGTPNKSPKKDKGPKQPNAQEKKQKQPKQKAAQELTQQVLKKKDHPPPPKQNQEKLSKKELKAAAAKKATNGQKNANPDEGNKEKSLAIPMKAKDKKKAKNNVSGSLTDKLKDSLKSSRFRFLNECLYKSQSSEAVQMFKEDPEAFAVYHEGYRQQVTHWPTNPLDRIIKAVRKMPKDQVVADFGCGDAKLSDSVSHKVYSLDLVATKPDVIACDMAKTPLTKETINVAVFCLSLMGTNLRDFLCEANRVLKPNGLLKVAEVKSRFDNVDEFLQHVQSCGFKVVDKDVNGEYFYYFNFKKIGDATKTGNQFSLKPCLYKKR